MASFITLEGGDGSGKSTLLKRIEQWLNQRKIPHVVTREPGGTPIAEDIRELLLKPRSTTMNKLSELFLFEAARAEHVENLIRPALNKGKSVLCDRFTHSSLAFQGYARGLGTTLVSSLNNAATSGLQPDAVIWLKLSPDEAKKRLAGRGGENRLDQEKAAFHEAVFRAFEQISKDEAERFIVLDAAKSPDEIFEQLLSHPKWMKLFGTGNGGENK